MMKGEHQMKFWVALVLFAVFAAAFVLSAVFLRKKKGLCIALMIITGLLAAAFLIYSGLTILFVNAVENSPPSP